MHLQRILKALFWHFRKLCNTLYYIFCNKQNVLVVNAPVFQFIYRIKNFNIGDDINFFLLKELSGKKIFFYMGFYHKPIENVMAIGSIIDWMSNDNSLIWGSGILTPPTQLFDKKKPYLIKEVYAVRGLKTRDCLLKMGIPCPEVYGDPALLLPYIYNPNVKRVQGRIGFIPHFSDMNDENISRLIRECGDKAIMIKVQNYSSWQGVIKLILSCEFIISSSLHGLILADAYNVPNLWITLPKGLKGGRFKFEDYYSAVGKPPISKKVDESTSITQISNMRDTYQKIHFNPLPLIKACPFKIVHPSILRMVQNS